MNPVIFWSITIFVFGLITGSFLNVCIYRMPKNISIISPPSHCPKCNLKIKWYDNIPLVSYIVLFGRCRNCKRTISPLYFIVELVTGFLFLTVFLFSDGIVETVFRLVLFSLLVLASFVDLEHFMIPDEVNIVGLIFAFFASTFFPQLQGEAKWYMGLYKSFLGAVTGFAALGMVAWLGSKVLKKDAMGFGDVKLISMIGAFGGWLVVLLGIMIASIVGTVIGGAFLLARNKTWKGKIPFGPYLAIGAMISILWGQNLINWYAEVFILQ